MVTLALVAVSVAGPDAARQQPVASHAAAVPPRPAAHEVARVNGVALMSDRLDGAVNTMIPLESFHRTVNAQKLREYRDKALARLIDEELQYQAGARFGVRPADAEVASGVARVRERYPSAQAFDAALRRAGITIEDVRREIRRSLIAGKAYDRFVTAQCQVSRDEAQRFFAANVERFVVPEQLHIQAITIGVDPSSTPRQWSEARARAEDVLRQVKAGGSFEDLARRHSTDPSRESGGDMGLVHRGSLNEEFEKATRDLKTGEVSGVVQTLFGFHIVRVAATVPPVRKTFAQVGEGIRRDLTKKRCDQASEAWMARLRAGASIVISDATPIVEPKAGHSRDRRP